MQKPTDEKQEFRINFVKNDEEYFADELSNNSLIFIDLPRYEKL